MRQTSIDLSIYARPKLVQPETTLPVIVEPRIVVPAPQSLSRASETSSLSDDMVADLYADNLRLMRDLQRARRFVWVWMLISALIGSAMMYLAGMLVLELNASRPVVVQPLPLTEAAAADWRRRDEIY